MWKFSTLNDCYIIGDILCVVQSCTRDPTGELRSETRIGRSLIRHCVCVLSISTYATTPDNKTHVPYDCIHVLHTIWQLYANDESFYKKKIGQLYDTLQFQLTVYAVIKITRRGIIVPFYEFAVKQPKKRT